MMFNSLKNLFTRLDQSLVKNNSRVYIQVVRPTKKEFTSILTSINEAFYPEEASSSQGKGERSAD